MIGLLTDLLQVGLNYGDEKMVKRLFEILGVDHVAQIFYAQTAAGRRVNYFPRTAHFFKLYFQKNASRNIKQ